MKNIVRESISLVKSANPVLLLQLS